LKNKYNEYSEIQNNGQVLFFRNEEGNPVFPGRPVSLEKKNGSPHRVQSTPGESNKVKIKSKKRVETRKNEKKNGR
jgi:hypothetical protein